MSKDKRAGRRPTVSPIDRAVTEALTEVALPPAQLPELPSDSYQTNTLLGELIVSKQQTLTHLQDELRKQQHAVLCEQTTLNQVKQQITDAKRQQAYDQQKERDQFRAGLQQEHHGLEAKRRDLERLDLELTSRRKDVEQMEAKAKPITDAMAKLRDERLAIESQRVRNEELRMENDRLANATSTRHEEVAQMKAALVAEQTRVQTRAVEQEQQQASIEQREKDLALKVENLSALKETIDPKLVEVRELEQRASHDRQQAEMIHGDIVTRQADLDKQRSDLATLSSQLEAKASALTEYDVRLKQTEAELRIKVQQAAVEVTVPEHPTV